VTRLGVSGRAQVAAQLVGLSTSVALLRNEAVTGSYAAFFSAWAVLIGTHCALRYMSLSVVTLPVLNLRRAKMLVCPSRRALSHSSQTVVVLSL